MANYPTSVFSPSARSNGQVIDASHVNDLQGEVTAIEGGLLNGTARLNSSNSTLANLSVTGGSTLATLNVTGGSTFAAVVLGASTLGSLSVTGASTVTTLQAGASTLTSLSVSGASTLSQLEVTGGSTLGTLVVSGASTFVVRPIAPPPDAVGAIGTGAINLTNDSTLAVLWMGQEFVTNSSMHSTAANQSLVVPQSTGIWAFNLAITLNASLAGSTSSLLVVVEDSSGGVLARGMMTGVSDVGPSVATVSGMKRFDVTGGSVRAVVKARSSDTHSIAVGGSFLQVYKL